MTKSSLVLCAGLALTSGALADNVSFDQMSGQPGVAGGSAWSVPSGGGSTASTGNRFLGVPITLAPGSTTITGFDTTMINNTGAALSIAPGWQVALNYWIWDSWTPSATTSPAFGSLAGSGSVPFTFNAGANVASNSFFFFTQNASPGAGIVPPIGVLPGVAITPVTVASSGPIGIVFNWTINRQDGNGFVLLGGLSQVIVGGAFAVPPAVGTNNFTGATMGYYRSASAESNGNFFGNSSRQIGNNSGLLMRVYTVPAPGALGLVGLGGLVATRRRR